MQIFILATEKKSIINLCMIMFGHDRRIICTHVCTNIILNTIVTTCGVSIQYNKMTNEVNLQWELSELH